jgi:hypothetical protein
MVQLITISREAMSTKACNLPNADTDKKENPLQ